MMHLENILNELNKVRNLLMSLIENVYCILLSVEENMIINVAFYQIFK